MKKNQNSNLFMFYGIISITAMIISNITAFKMVELGPFVLPAAVFLFPLTYIISDVVVEVYGLHKAKMLIWCSFAMNLVAVLYFAFTVWLPAPVWFEGAEAYSTVLSSTPRVLIAGLVAFLTGSFVNSHIMSSMKSKAKGSGKGFAIRAMVSTVFGEGLDAIIFITVAFIGTMPLDAMLVMIASQAGFKIAFEAVLMPITIKMVSYTKDREMI